ncbi:hypothetical protein [Paraburkholderia sp. CNPSo 3281]|uniref:hypothetical protein n=1 Tax=Paraburkholderia sp. CNPSo 3281 TaxID=2940933 RepID=UPI0020B80E38|nr:hypothetical protein [Paraburkholderia sp. CNPSo 3281]MCP3717909.1 hypothetical protein [Paraburkholderia sp. CNPSo 3281]
MSEVRPAPARQDARAAFGLPFVLSGTGKRVGSMLKAGQIRGALVPHATFFEVDENFFAGFEVPGGSYFFDLGPDMVHIHGQMARAFVGNLRFPCKLNGLRNDWLGTIGQIPVAFETEIRDNLHGSRGDDGEQPGTCT